MYWNCGLGICSPRTEGTRDAPLRTSAWEAMLYSQGTDHLKTYQWIGGGGGRGGEVQKKMFAQGKFKWQKIHARQLTLQNIHATAWKIHTRNLITKKKFLRLENSPPLSHNFSNGPSLEHQYCVARKKPIRRKSVCGFVARFLLW